MNKRLAALAASLALAGTAAAQSNVTLYGLVDIGIAHESGGPSGSLTKMDGSGLHSGNRWGLRGTEDLGGGLSAIFTLESGFNSDTGAGAGALFGRQSWVGVKGGFGTVTFGRQYTPHWAAIDGTDAMDGISGGIHNLMRRVVRTDNTVKYTSPDFSGFSGQLAYGFGEVEGNTAASRHIGFGLNYAAGPLVVRLAHHDANNATDTDNARNTYLGGSYNFGPAKLFLGHNIEKGVAGLDRNATQVGVQVPFGASTVMATYVHKNDKSAANDDARMLGLAYTYALSKRTNIYASVLRIDNENSLVYRTKGGDGIGDREFNVGIRHKF